MRSNSIFLFVLCAALLPAPRQARAGFGFSESAWLKPESAADARNDYFPIVAGAPNGVWIGAWHSTDNLHGGAGDTDILFVRSTDDGVTWSPTRFLNSDSEVDGGDDYGVSLNYAGNGVWLAFWMSTSVIGTPQTSNIDIHYATSADDGITWTYPRNLNSNATYDIGDDFRPSCACDLEGTCVATWSSNDKFNNATGDDSDVFMSKSTDFGGTWSEMVLISGPSSGNGDALILTDVATDDHGNWLIIWSSRDDLNNTIGNDYDILYCKSADNALSWSAPSVLNNTAYADQGDDGLLNTSFQQNGPHIECDTSGDCIVVWGSTTNLIDGGIGDAEIQFSRTEDMGGSWTSPSILNSTATYDLEGASGYDGNPAIAHAPSGEWFVVWETTGFSVPGFNTTNLAISKSSDLGVTWSRVSALNFNQAMDISGQDTGPDLATNGSTWIVVWYTDQTLLAADNYDVLFSRSGNTSAPPDLSPSLRLLMDVLTGRLRMDYNNDGRIDDADLLLGLILNR